MGFPFDGSSRDYVPGPEYPGYVALDDDEVLVDDQLLPADALPTALSQGYVADSDPSEEDLEEDLADYHVDGEDEEEEEEESSEDDDDDDDGEDEASEEDEEEEHLAPTDSIIATPPPPPPPRSPRTKVYFSQTRLRRARKTVRLQPPMAASTEVLIAEFAFAPTPPSPPPSPLSPWSSPLPHIPSPPLLVLSPPLTLPSPPIYTSPTYAEAPLGYRAAMIQSRATSPPHVPSPPLLFEVGESSTAAAAKQTGHTLAHRRVTDLATTQRQDAHELHIHDEEAQDISSYVVRYFRSMASSYKQEAVIARQAWSRSEDRSTALKASFGRIHALEARDRARTRDARHQDGPADVEMPPKKTTASMMDVAIKQLIAQGVGDALAEHEANRNSRNGDDSHDSGSGERRQGPTTRECTYSDFLNANPLISRTVGHDVAYEKPWKTLKKMMTAKYYPRSEIKKLEIEIRNLKVKGTDVVMIRVILELPRQGSRPAARHNPNLGFIIVLVVAQHMNNKRMETPMAKDTTSFEDDEFAFMSTEDIQCTSCLLNNEISILKEELQRTNLELDSFKEKIKLNKRFPYLVGNIVEKFFGV
ncbi:hypothetical protein Tco_1194948 [Tanacetum coccineum]